MIKLIKKVWGKIVTPVKNDESIFVACFSLVVIGLIIYIFTSQPGQFSLRDNSLFKETQTFSPTTTQAPSPAVRAAKTVKVIPTVDSDPIIECKSELCNGGKLRQSVCSNSTCCQIGDKWYFYLSKARCKSNQDEYYNTVFPGSNSNNNSPISKKSSTTVCNCKGYDGVGGPCYAGVGGPAYDGVGGPAYDGVGGPCYAGVGGPCYSGIGGRGNCPSVCK